MPIDPATAKAIVDEVNALVDGAGVGFVKIRVRGRRVRRLYANASKPVPAGDLCPRDQTALEPRGDAAERRWFCGTCRYGWRREQLIALRRAADRRSLASELTVVTG